MADFGLPETEVTRCEDTFKEQIKRDDEKERDYLTYEELKAGLEHLLGYKFRRDYIFFKLISELENAEPNKIRFSDFLNIYSK